MAATWYELYDDSDVRRWWKRSLADDATWPNDANTFQEWPKLAANGDLPHGCGARMPHSVPELDHEQWDSQSLSFDEANAEELSDSDL
jgi:hypothetical protein